ncbi:hypothetical protein ABW20_dc0110073 [Dactylellina cionopaga]|nr:hypothetical protein ABW20_dc0110073 [Dactylellina cionopaga]
MFPNKPIIPGALLLAFLGLLTPTLADIPYHIILRFYFTDNSVKAYEIDPKDDTYCHGIDFPIDNPSQWNKPQIGAITAETNLLSADLIDDIDFTIYLKDDAVVCDPDDSFHDLDLPYYAPGWGEDKVMSINNKEMGGRPSFPSFNWLWGNQDNNQSPRDSVIDSSGSDSDPGPDPDSEAKRLSNQAGRTNSELGLSPFSSFKQANSPDLDGEENESIAPKRITAPNLNFGNDLVRMPLLPLRRVDAVDPDFGNIVPLHRSNAAANWLDENFPIPPFKISIPGANSLSNWINPFAIPELAGAGVESADDEDNANGNPDGENEAGSPPNVERRSLTVPSTTENNNRVHRRGLEPSPSPLIPNFPKNIPPASLMSKAELYPQSQPPYALFGEPASFTLYVKTKKKSEEKMVTEQIPVYQGEVGDAPQEIEQAYFDQVVDDMVDSLYGTSTT